MIFDKVLSHGKKEQMVIENIQKHIKLLCYACDLFKRALEQHDRNLMRKVIDLEREGDSIRREIISNVYKGAFLPYLRPDLCKFVEIVDHIFDLLEDNAYHYIDIKLPEQIDDECIRVAFLNLRICEILMITFKAMLKGEDLREKTLAIRIYEKKIDDIKVNLIREVRKIRVDTFLEGKILSDFISYLTKISDVIEDAGDHLQIINLSYQIT